MISIVGAGPSANYLAYLLAKKGRNVNVYEEHKVIGAPVQCTGIMTNYINSLVKLKKPILMNKLGKVRVYSPNKKYIDFKLKNPDIVVDRSAFDKMLSEKAMDVGVNYNLDYKYISNKQKKIKFKTSKGFVQENCDYLVDCAGPRAPVATFNKLKGERKYVMGFQVTCDLELERLYEVWLGYGAFAWVVPEGNGRSRVGLVGSSKKEFDSFLKMRIGNNKIYSNESGIIPVYSKLQTQKDWIYVLGDAASMVKATSYGGIILSMLAGEELCNSIVNGGNYEKKWKKRIGKDLVLSLKIRRILDKFSRNDFNDLVRLISSGKAKEIIENNDRDFPTKFALNLLLAEPRLMKYGFKIF